jgi:hypothetical protein
MAAFSNEIQNEIYQIIQDAKSEGYAEAELVRMLAEIIVYISND